MLAALGYSINTITLFALVLAIGLVVDDAILVVENVHRLMTDQGLSPGLYQWRQGGNVADGAVLAPGVDDAQQDVAHEAAFDAQLAAQDEVAFGAREPAASLSHAPTRS